MGKVIDIGIACLNAVQALKLQIGDKPVVLDTKTGIPDSTAHHMIVGNEYEMYEPIAKESAAQMGIIWNKPDYTFTYAGVLAIGDSLFIVTKDITYDPKLTPVPHKAQLDWLTEQLGDGLSIFCPTYIAVRWMRPAT